MGGVIKIIYNLQGGDMSKKSIWNKVLGKGFEITIKLPVVENEYSNNINLV